MTFISAVIVNDCQKDNYKTNV